MMHKAFHKSEMSRAPLIGVMVPVILGTAYEAGLGALSEFS